MHHPLSYIGNDFIYQNGYNIFFIFCIGTLPYIITQLTLVLMVGNQANENPKTSEAQCNIWKWNVTL